MTDRPTLNTIYIQIERIEEEFVNRMTKKTTEQLHESRYFFGIIKGSPREKYVIPFDEIYDFERRISDRLIG